MCRLLGILSSEPTSAENYLIGAECSLLQQSRIDPKRLQGDGWGIGYYVDKQSQVVKSERPAYSEVERFKTIASDIKSRIIIAHVRAASNPRGLPRERLISLKNSQPFNSEGFLFAHNGTVNLPDEVTELLGDYRAKVEGINDSETYFWFLVKELEAGVSIPDALVDFENALHILWDKFSTRHPNMKGPYIGLNAIFADGQKLYAYCRYAEEDGRSMSICLGDQPVFQMCYRPGNIFIVASEKLTNDDEWLPLTSGQLLTVEVKGEGIVHDVESLNGLPSI